MSVNTISFDFRHNYNNNITATIETNNLILRSIKEEDADSCANSCYDVCKPKQAVNRCLDGTTKTMEQTAEAIKILTNRWLIGDPFSGFSVHIKNERKNDTFAGIVILGHGDHPGVAKLEGIGSTEFWDKGYGIEATEALIHLLASHLAAEPYLVGPTPETRQPLKKIVATCRTDSTYALRTLDCIMRRNIQSTLHDGMLWINYEHNLPQKSRHMCVLL
ncbi:MAG TPA: GNAT family N-acetyltransferase [Chlamydiales bacterium]|jgi:hypothetical protein|nr:GNAT family N-acetyltransferase [Chlamydiales bacterium]